MIEVERQTTAGPGRLWDLVSDLARWDKMLPTVQAVTRLDADDEVGVGTRMEMRQPGLSRAVYEVTEWQPAAGFTWVSAAPGVRTTATHEIRAHDGQTSLVLGIDWTGPLAPLVRLLLGAKVRRMVEREADTFTRLARVADDR